MSEHRRHHDARGPGHRTRRPADRLTRALRAGWEAHRRLLESNPAYAATLAAVVAAIVTQADPADLIAALVAGALAVYAACRHVTDY